MYEVKGTESALNAEEVLIGRTISRLYVYYLVVPYNQVILAACSAVRAGRQDLLYTAGLILFPVLGDKSACRAGLSTVTAALTSGLLPVRSEGCINKCTCTDLAILQRPGYTELIAGSHTPLAVDTQLRIIGEERILLLDYSLVLGHLIAGACDAILS